MLAGFSLPSDSEGANFISRTSEASMGNGDSMPEHCEGIEFTPASAKANSVLDTNYIFCMIGLGIKEFVGKL